MSLRAYQLARQLSECLAAERPDLAPVADKLVRNLCRCSHSVDFASVLWYGTAHTFTASQARVVGVLWTAWRQGTPEVRQETLLEAVGSDLSRLAKLFGDNPAWGTMIVGGEKKGAFRLGTFPHTSTSPEIENSLPPLPKTEPLTGT